MDYTSQQTLVSKAWNDDIRAMWYRWLQDNTVAAQDSHQPQDHEYQYHHGQDTLDRSRNGADETLDTPDDEP